MTDMPKHVAIILDGNRRLALRMKLDPWKGHEWGAEKVRKLMKWCKEAGIRYITLYAFSIQNFERPKMERKFIFDIFERELRAILEDAGHDVHKNRIRIRAIGRLEKFKEERTGLFELIKRVEEVTKDYDGYFLNLAVAYGGQEEIADVTRSLARKVSEGIMKPEEINEDIIRHSLYTNGQPYPDMIIRTGGEKRLSNFLIWQGAYSELFFTDTKWPEFTKEEFFRMLEEFRERERRFGR